MNTQLMINKALTSEPMRSPLGHNCDWLVFAMAYDVEVQVSIWGNKSAPTKTRAIFRIGSKRISRSVADQRIQQLALTESQNNRNIERDAMDAEGNFTDADKAGLLDEFCREQG